MSGLAVSDRAAILSDPFEYWQYFGAPLSKEQAEALLKSASSLDPEATYHALARLQEKLAWKPDLLTMAASLAQRLKERSSSVTTIAKLKLNDQVWRNPNVGELKQVVFSDANPYARSSASYLLMDALGADKP